MRSFQLNFEVTLIVYDRGFACSLAALTDRYVGDAERLAPEVWAQRPQLQRLTENFMQLMSPLL